MLLTKPGTAFLVLLALTTAVCADDIPIGVFKGDSYDSWTVKGTAFKPGPVGGEMLTTLEIENAPDGARVACSEVDGDGPTGTLTKFVLPGENGLSIRADEGAVKIRWLEVYALRSVWGSAETPRAALRK